MSSAVTATALTTPRAAVGVAAALRTLSAGRAAK